MRWLWLGLLGVAACGGDAPAPSFTFEPARIREGRSEQLTVRLEDVRTEVSVDYGSEGESGVRRWPVLRVGPQSFEVRSTPSEPFEVALEPLAAGRYSVQLEANGERVLSQTPLVVEAETVAGPDPVEQVVIMLQPPVAEMAAGACQPLGFAAAAVDPDTGESKIGPARRTLDFEVDVDGASLWRSREACLDPSSEDARRFVPELRSGLTLATAWLRAEAAGTRVATLANHSGQVTFLQTWEAFDLPETVIAAEVFDVRLRAPRRAADVQVQIQVLGPAQAEPAYFEGLDGQGRILLASDADAVEFALKAYDSGTYTVVVTAPGFAPAVRTFFAAPPAGYHAEVPPVLPKGEVIEVVMGPTDEGDPCTPVFVDGQQVLATAAEFAPERSAGRPQTFRMRVPESRQVWLRCLLDSNSPSSALPAPQVRIVPMECKTSDAVPTPNPVAVQPPIAAVGEAVRFRFNDDGTDEVPLSHVQLRLVQTPNTPGGLAEANRFRRIVDGDRSEFVHAFSEPGVYVVEVTERALEGCPMTHRRRVVVLPDPSFRIVTTSDALQPALLLGALAVPDLDVSVGAPIAVDVRGEVDMRFDPALGPDGVDRQLVLAGNVRQSLVRLDEDFFWPGGALNVSGLSFSGSRALILNGSGWVEASVFTEGTHVVADAVQGQLTIGPHNRFLDQGDGPKVWAKGPATILRNHFWMTGAANAGVHAASDGVDVVGNYFSVRDGPAIWIEGGGRIAFNGFEDNREAIRIESLGRIELIGNLFARNDRVLSLDGSNQVFGVSNLVSAVGQDGVPMTFESVSLGGWTGDRARFRRPLGAGFVDRVASMEPPFDRQPFDSLRPYYGERFDAGHVELPATR